MEIHIIIQQIFVLFILALIGLVATKLNIIQRDIKTGITKIIFNITLPFLIITQISSLEVDKQILLSWGMVIAFAFLSIILFLQIGRLSKNLLKLPENKAPIHMLHTAFGNAVFLGFPILAAIFPNGEGLLYGIIYFLTQNTMMWTIGIFIFTRQKNSRKIDSLKNLLNPNTIAFLIGLTMLLLNIRIPGFMFETLQGLGKTTLYLAMLYIGAILADVNLRAIVKNKSTFILSLNKLIIGPFILMVIMHLILTHTPLALNMTAQTVIIMESAMPCMTLLVILARKYHKDDFYATQNLSISTLLSIITLPLIFYLSQIIL
ncbi:MAG: AEC family transporter [Bacteroidales bacterium]|nr:AEC family transporter [Bacteroidales bacterium]